MIRKKKNTKSMKQDLKRLMRRGYDMRKLLKVVNILCNGEPIPPEYENHPLHGDKTGKFDLHIENDWVLIYYFTDEYVYFCNTGTHSDLKLMR